MKRLIWLEGIGLVRLIVVIGFLVLLNLIGCFCMFVMKGIFLFLVVLMLKL